MILGKVINTFRREQKMSMELFAEKAGLTKGYISMLEKNEHPKSKKPILPTYDTLEKVAKGMGIEFEELIDMLDPDQEIQINITAEEYSGLISSGIEKNEATISTISDISDIDIFVGNKIKEHRKRLGLTQTELSEILEMKTYTTISKWEAGENFPKGKDIKRLAELFNVSSDYLLGLTNKQVNDISITSSKLDEPKQKNVLNYAKEQLNDNIINLDEKRKEQELDEFVERSLNSAVANDGKRLTESEREFFGNLLKEHLKNKKEDTDGLS